MEAQQPLRQPSLQESLNISSNLMVLEDETVGVNDATELQSREYDREYDRDKVVGIWSNYHHVGKTYLRRFLNFLAIGIPACVVAIFVIRDISFSHYAGHHGKYLPVGSDYGNFVPSDVSSRPVIWISKLDDLWVRGEAFQNISILEEILSKWHDRFGTFYVPAGDYDRDGPQVPFKDGTFAIGVFHQMHCLTVLLEDFGRLAAGTPPEQLPSYREGPQGYWAKHKAHCFNQLRQALECFSDSTAEGHNELLDPERHHHAIADTGVVHMCNDFPALLAWKNERLASGKSTFGVKV